MECAHEVGSVSIGKKARLNITVPMASVAHLPYAFGNILLQPLDKFLIA
jgi:hypothetical protein